ncbi:MAG: hypothetical protein RJB65_2417, partial [Actinomycetota bacterium]
AVAISPRLMTAAARNRPVRPVDRVVRTCFPPYVLYVDPEALGVTPITPRFPHLTHTYGRCRNTEVPSARGPTARRPDGPPAVAVRAPTSLLRGGDGAPCGSGRGRDTGLSRPGLRPRRVHREVPRRPRLLLLECLPPLPIHTRRLTFCTIGIACRCSSPPRSPRHSPPWPTALVGSRSLEAPISWCW